MYRTILQTSSRLTPQIKLNLMDPECPSWSNQKYEDSPFQKDPFWAIYWPGGQVLTKYILDHPHLVKGKKVLDLGCGCGATGIGASLMGAKTVLMNDIDQEALRATLSNAKANRVSNLKISSTNYLQDAESNESFHNESFDIIFIGDMFYDHEIVDSLLRLIRDFKGDVLIGDPGRWALKEARPNMTCLAKYNLPNITKNENYGFHYGYVYQLLQE